MSNVQARNHPPFALKQYHSITTTDNPERTPPIAPSWTHIPGNDVVVLLLLCSSSSSLCLGHTTLDGTGASRAPLGGVARWCNDRRS